MTTIRANCPSCGDVQLRASDLTVRVCSDDEQGSYCFQCPTCAQAVAKDASRRIVDLLVSSGVRMEVWRMPAELTERQGRPAGAATRWDAQVSGATPVDPGPALELQTGDDVVHASFGDGVVTGVEAGGVVVVRFAVDGSERKLMADYAPIRKR